MAATFTCWGIFGAGKIAHDFVIALKTLPEDEHKVVSVASRSLERASEFADKHKIGKAYGSYEELAQDANVEVVYVSTIHPQHAWLCKLALNHGKHVLCEKPMTMNLKETKEVFELAKAKGLFIMEVRCREDRQPFVKALVSLSNGCQPKVCFLRSHQILGTSHTLSIPNKSLIADSYAKTPHFRLIPLSLSEL